MHLFYSKVHILLFYFNWGGWSGEQRSPGTRDCPIAHEEALVPLTAYGNNLFAKFIFNWQVGALRASSIVCNGAILRSSGPLSGTVPQTPYPN